MLWMTTNIGFRLVCSTQSTIFIRPYTIVISIFFILYKMLWMTTNIGLRLVCSTPINHIHQTLYQVISIFFILYKMLWMTTNIGFRLVCSTPSTMFIRPYTKWFPSFSFSTKCSEWQQILDLGGTVLPHQPCSSDLIPSWFPSFFILHMNDKKCSEGD